MKTTHLKWIAISVSTLMLMQSCSVYHSKVSTVDDAIASKTKVKAVTFDDVTYKFDDLIREEGELYGIAIRKSRTTRKLENLIVNENTGDKFIKISVPENTIRGYYLKNKTVSTILTITAVVISIGWILFIRSVGDAFSDAWN